MTTKLDEIERSASGENAIWMARDPADILALVAVARAAEKDHTQHGRLKRMDKCEVCKALAPLLAPVGTGHGEGAAP